MRRTTHVLLLALALVACMAGVVRADDHLPVLPQIVGGGDAPDPHPYVYQVSIGTAGQPPKDAHFCGGALIAARWVLTAAHCFESSDPTRIHVVVGARTLSLATAEDIYTASRLVLHPDYDPKGRAARGEANDKINDIALIELANPVPDANRIIALIALDQENTLAPVGTMATLAGWGGLQGYPAGENPPENQTYPDILQAVGLPIVADAACGQVYALDQAMQMCAGYDAGGKDGCQGDSGGPLVVSNGQNGYVQVGVVSFGAGCAAPNYPGVYTRVTGYLDWVGATVNPPEYTEQLYLPALAK